MVHTFSDRSNTQNKQTYPFKTVLPSLSFGSRVGPRWPVSSIYLSFRCYDFSESVRDTWLISLWFYQGMFISVPQNNSWFIFYTIQFFYPLCQYMLHFWIVYDCPPTFIPTTCMCMFYILTCMCMFYIHLWCMYFIS